MGERRGTKALELWCRRITEGYPGVNVQNMTTSWRDGLAFCAMIHHFRPDLIDFNSLNKDDVYGNNELAFRTAEQHLGIPALLDAEDMASCSVPDRLSILTYLSQFYQTFGGSSPSRLAMSRTTETSDERIAPVPESPKQKVGSRLGLRRDPCAACGLPVFLAEKLMIARTLYHRTCFRCARCNNQLTPGNYYETEESQYCCETCPDEESTSPTMHQKYNKAVVAGDGPRKIADDEVTEGSSYQRSLSDEEKSGRQQAYEYNDVSAKRIGPQDAQVPDLIAQTSQMRLNFMTNHLLSERNEELPMLDGSRVEEDEEEVREGGERGTGSRVVEAFPDDEDQDEEEGEEEEEEDEEGFSSSIGPSTKPTDREKKAPIEETGGDLVKNVVHSALDVRVDSKEDEELRPTAISFHDVVKDKSVSLVNREDDTKEVLGKADERGDAEGRLSLVQKRLRMFEAQDKKDHVERMVKGHVKTAVDTSDSRLKSEERSRVETSHQADVPKSPLTSAEIPKAESKAEVAKIAQAIDPPERRTEIDRISPETEDSAEIDRLDVAEENLPTNVDLDDVSEESGRKSDGASTIPDRSSSLSLDRCKDTAPVDASVDEGHSKVEGSTVDDSMNETSLTTAEGIDLSAKAKVYPEDLNPFKSDDDEDDVTDKFQTALDSSKSSKVSTNPFGSESEEDEVLPPKPAARSNVNNSKAKQQATAVQTKRLLAAPQISLNPFWSDDEDEHDSDFELKERTPGNVPVPKPRTIKKHTPELGVTQRKSHLNRGGLYASNSSITSSESATTPGGTYRKKKPAPPPPTAKELFPSDQRTSPMLKSYTNSPGYQGVSPRTTPRTRKTKPAPPPPIPTSTPYNLTVGAPLNFGESPIPESRDVSDVHMWEDQKTNKDEANRNRQSLTNVSSSENLGYKSYPDKSVQGKWKRKKGPAPPRPIPHRRKIKVMSLKDVKLELDEIELQQQGLERQGVRLEQLIRDKCETGTKIDDSSLSIDVEELVLELFALVNEKNELFRRQAELMLLRRQQRLEEEHAEVEYQIRCLMSQPEATKTDFDKQREEALIQRLVEIVERRNEIVECLEMDRRREVEEDRSIHKHMGLFAARNKNEISGYNNDSSHSSKTKKGKSKEKGKEKKSKKMSKKDADKDVDETEVKLKRHNKRKWF